MRRTFPVAVLIAASFATASMGLPLTGEGGKFSFSNIFPILFCVVAAVLFLAARGRVEKRVIGFFLLFNSAAFVSFAIFLVRFRWEPNFLVLFFQDVEILFCLLLLWYARTNHREFRAAVHAGIWGCAAVMAIYGWLDFSAGNLNSAFGMDDKSHTAVLLCGAAFILLRFFGGRLDILLALGLFAASFLTLSRLPVMFTPAIFMALAAMPRYGAALATVAAAGVVTLLAVAADIVAQTFLVFDRLSSVETISGEGSTHAHLLLIQSGLRMKFDDVWSFLFGIGPGNFSKALTSFHTFTAELQAVDPILVADAQVGKAPMHSLPVSLLLDWNLVIFFLAIFLLFKAVGYLLRIRDFVGLAFVAGFFAASTFYSLHNKPYFYLLVATVVALTRDARERSQRPLPAVDAAQA